VEHYSQSVPTPERGNHLKHQPNENTAMNLERRYIVDENNQKIAVQLDIETFEKIENILENHAIYQLMLNNSDEEELNLEDAIKHYKNLCDNQCN
jgi:DNA transposition AAA+ family ATPase